MSFQSLMFDEQGLPAESAEEAFRRIAARNLRERGCPEVDIQPSVERLLAKPVKLELKEPVEP